jgi:RimJ/RimL family protein N-acetyltransferase
MNGTFIGYCGVVRAPDHKFDELIYVYHRATWGKGYATEAGQCRFHPPCTEARLSL